MSIDLTINKSISEKYQPVMDQEGNISALSIGKTTVNIKSNDVPGKWLPFGVNGEIDGDDTWGRLMRLANKLPNGTTEFYDIGIDQSGNLFINSSQSSKTDHVLKISPNSTIDFGNLETPPPGVATVDVVVDPKTGNLYRQS